MDHKTRKKLVKLARKSLAEHHDRVNVEYSERRRYISTAPMLHTNPAGPLIFVISLGASFITKHSDYLVAGGGILIIIGVTSFGLRFREKIDLEFSKLSTLAKTGEDDSAISDTLLKDFFREAEISSYWHVIFGTAMSSFPGLLWRWLGWS